VPSALWAGAPVAHSPTQWARTLFIQRGSHGGAEIMHLFLSGKRERAVVFAPSFQAFRVADAPK